MPSGRPSRALRSRPIRLSIHVKLIGLISVMMTAIVGFLTIYFPARQSATIHAGLSARARSYGAMLATQARSAVAFSDRETAREILSPLDDDPYVASIALFDDHGETLYAHGSPSDWVERAKLGVVSPRLFALNGRVAFVAPVASLEGPSGTLVIELTTAIAHRNLVVLVKTAVSVGIAVLFFGIAAAWLIARSLARRLRAIAEVATRVGSSDGPPELVDDRSSDEIGALASAFNAMVQELHAEDERLRSTVSELTQAEDALARANRELEDRVEARTAELTATNQKLVVEMEERSRMELELRQAQKLESVGRLAAGVAHEINTPIQFVSDSCHFLREATGDIAQVVDGYRQLVAGLGDGPGRQEAADAARRLEDDHDIGYLLENMPTAVARSIEGLERVATIVRALKEFAYPERKDLTLVDVNRAIETTLMVSTNEYRYVAETRTELEEVPKVLCRAGELNQVILNIVVNAAHAIADVVGDSGDKGEIAIRTWATGPDVFISIRDTGGGIPPEVVDKIFDPFFTTKEVGKGTGQGLAIARSVIVDKHGGKLAVETEVGAGSTFTITLPAAAAGAATGAAAATAAPG